MDSRVEHVDRVDGEKGFGGGVVVKARLTLFSKEKENWVVDKITQAKDVAISCA